MKKDFISIADWTKDEILDFLELATDLKNKQRNGIEHHYLKGKTLAMFFMKPSMRTRVSFEVGMFQLGGHALYLGPAEIGMGKRETVEDVARVTSRYCDGIMARVFDHSYVTGLAEWASVPVINGLSDMLHPCQIMSDMLTIMEVKGRYEGIHVAWIGDGNNVCHSWINIASRLPMKLTIGTPPGYEPNADILAAARESGISEIIVTNSAEEAARGADVLYGDVWASMGQEEEAAERLKEFSGFQINDKLFSFAHMDAILLHCLPAHRGEEVTHEVMEGPRSVVFDQAENRMHLEKALLAKLMG